MNFEEMKYIFLVLINQFNVHEFQKFMVWLDKLVEEYKLSGSIAKYQYDMQINCSNCANNETGLVKIESMSEQNLQKSSSSKIQHQQSDFNSSELNSSSDNDESSVYRNDDTRQQLKASSLKSGYLSKLKSKLSSECNGNGLNNNNDSEYLDDADMNNQSEALNTPSTVEFLVRKKRPKGFSAMQKFELEKLFSSKKYISTEERNELASRLDLTQVQIKDWFKNHRKLMRRSLEQQHFKNAALQVTRLPPGSSSSDKIS